ncbi:MAG: hypothetical protein ACT4PT_08255 [Methanobacteriota archaeon]
MATPGFVLNATSPLLFVALGIFALTIRPRTRVTLAFAAYCVGLGVSISATQLPTLVWDVAADGPVRAAMNGLSAAAYVVWGLALAILALTFPAPIRRDERAALPWVALVAATYLALRTFGIWFVEADADVALRLYRTGTGFAVASALSSGLLFAWRHRNAGAAADRRPFVLLSAGTIPYVLVIAAGNVVDAPHPSYQAAATWGLIVGLLVVLLWLASAARGADARGARNMAIVAAASLFVGSAAYVWAGEERSLDDLGFFGVIRLVTFALFAYAILQHQLLGIDVKVRWGISKSTVAAVFIAVFFVVSEGAQVLFGADNPWIGVVAAGMLVFALAPLQRVADRLAAKAVPMGAAGVSDARETYRVLYRKVRADGVVTRDEERALARAASGLGLAPHEVFEIRDDVEREAPR